MPAPKCLHEVDLATMAQSLEENTKDTKLILKILQGNGGEGLVTKVALTHSSISRAWWWLGGISMGLIAIAFFVIRAGLT